MGVPTPGESDSSASIVDVFDNVVCDSRLEGEVWGLACAVDSDAGRTLFDTGGDGEVLLSNMSILGISADSVDRIFLSHADDDHANGLEAFLKMNCDVTVFALSSFPSQLRDMVEAAGAVCEEVTRGEAIAAGLRSTGEMGESKVEHSLVIDTPSGPLLLTGCAHPGIVAIARRAAEIAGAPPCMIIGGLHLWEADPDDVRAIAAGLREIGVKRIAPCHCTGPSATAIFEEAWGEGFVAFGAGTRVAL